MTVIIKGLEYTKQVMHNAIAHLLPTDAQLVPKQRSSDPSQPHSPQFMYWTWCHMARNIALASLGQLSWLCPLPTSCAPPAFLLAGHEKLKNPWLGLNATGDNWKHQCVINILLILNPKHSTIPATRKKINSVLAETRTTIFSYPWLVPHVTHIHALKSTWSLFMTEHLHKWSDTNEP